MGQNKMTAEIDFDAYAEQAKSDPTCFAAERERLIAAQIANSHDPKKAAEYQLQIDGMRFKKSPGIAACRRLESELLDRLEILVNAMNKLEKELDGVPGKL